MARSRDADAEILAFLGALGWRTGDDAEDLARVRAAGGRPRGRVTAASVLAKVHAAPEVPSPAEEPPPAIPFTNPLATGFSRAARNRKTIDAETDKRMKEDKAKARQKKAKPKDP